MSNPPEPKTLSPRSAFYWSVAAVASFHVAYSFPKFNAAIVLFLFCLFQLRNLGSKRQAFYIGLGVGLALYAPQLSFFFTIFGFGAIPLWLVLAFWIGLFLLLAHVCARRFSALTAAILIPILWTGLEYFRSELYYLRFSWLNIGYVFQGHAASTLGFLGVYGIGFVFALIVSLALTFRNPKKVATVSLATAPLLMLGFAPFDLPMPSSANMPLIAGVQLEFPNEMQVVRALDKLVAKHPAAELLVLSEYTFTEALPERVKTWCKVNKRYLVVGAQDPVGDSNFYNTAFVIDPAGEVVFKQVKSVPIQFFKDGLPAPEQKLWNSPWGKIGICICYDLSYRRVVDELVRQGAQALIVPTMDVVSWGQQQHELHARVAPMRAAEYRIPLYRVCSSGISQFVDARGYVRASAPFPGEDESLATPLAISTNGRLPFDRWLAPFCVLVTSVLIVFFTLSALSKIFKKS